MKSRTEVASARFAARVYLTQARATPWPQWRATLLGWAKRLRTAGHAKVGQMELFQ